MVGLTEANHSVVKEFAQMFYTERSVRASCEKHVTEDYVQHNASYPDGREAAILGLTRMPSIPWSRFEIQRILMDSSIAAGQLRGHVGGQPLVAIADFFRLAGGTIVEHGDGIQLAPENSVNPLLMI